MRFVPDGPRIPNDLLRLWRKGEVLLFAGAGVSVSANLPLFKGLAMDVYEHCGDTAWNPLKNILRRSNISEKTTNKHIDAGALSPKQKVEVELMLGNQLDRLFAAMESRLDHDEKGRARSRKVRQGVESVLRRSTKHAPQHADLLRISMPPVAVSGKREECRIATTNFDRLFEAAWQAEFGTTFESYDARIAPRPGAPGFKGIIHLHGVLTADPTVESDFVLTSRDFARVYLRSGVVANYVYDLIRRYVVVLIGYSADDPPMRYLMDAIGEDVGLFKDMSRPYALADREGADPRDPDGVVAAERWRSKNIEPILFPAPKGPKRFDPLWNSIGAWADWAREDTKWVDRELEEKTRVPYGSATAFARTFVTDLLSLLEQDELERAITVLKGLGVDFDWIEAISVAVSEDKSA
jgi:hypothetical protein